MKQSVIAIFDIGKTNKKLLLFNEDYQTVFEETASFEEILDEDGFPCEDMDSLTKWITDSVRSLSVSDDFQLKAVNFTTYGASILLLDANGNRLTSLYNYLKPYPSELIEEFTEHHHDVSEIAVETCSPLMGSLNAGMQLYRIKQQHPRIFEKIHAVLPFPQFLSFQFTKRFVSEMTYVGCHSFMWDFKNLKYHPWLEEEGISSCLMPVVNGNEAIKSRIDNSHEFWVGTGLHDSSAAIIPYLLSFKEPFVIVSTGTWTISLNPFNKKLPDEEELGDGCLSYLTYEGVPVKVSMLFAGHDHDQQTKRIAEHFKQPAGFFKSLTYDARIMNEIRMYSEEGNNEEYISASHAPTDPCFFHRRNLDNFRSASQAYHQLVADIIKRQAKATGSVINDSGVKNLYVDGGFCKNTIYMQQLADAFPDINVYSSSMTQGTALGAALAIHHHWNEKELPSAIIGLKPWKKTENLSIKAS